MGNLILEAEKTVGKIVGPESNVIFNTASPYSPRISYDSTNGEIIFLEVGQYLVLWWIATEITQKGPIQFALKTSDGELLLGNSSSKRGQTSGFGVIEVGEVGTTLSLVNMTTYQVILCPRLELTSKIVAMKMPEESVTPTFSVDSVDTLEPGEDATADIQRDAQDPNHWLFSFGIPKGEMGSMKAYRANLNTTNRTLLVPIKDLTLEIIYVDIGNLDAYLIPSRTMTVDVRRIGIHGTGGVSCSDQQFNNYQLLSRTRIDDNFFNRSNEKWFAWIRQQDQNGLWSLHEVSIFSSNSGARTTAWVTLIEENVDYDNPNNPVD